MHDQDRLSALPDQAPVRPATNTTNPASTWVTENRIQDIAISITHAQRTESLQECVEQIECMIEAVHAMITSTNTRDILARTGRALHRASQSHAEALQADALASSTPCHRRKTLLTLTMSFSAPTLCWSTQTRSSRTSAPATRTSARWRGRQRNNDAARKIINNTMSCTTSNTDKRHADSEPCLPSPHNAPPSSDAPRGSKSGRCSQTSGAYKTTQGLMTQQRTTSLDVPRNSGAQIWSLLLNIRRIQNNRRCYDNI